jgi:hypothetical protein
MFVLVRASQVENKKIAEGKVDKKPPPPLPWEQFEFLTRYYGGVRTLVPLNDSTPQYPRLEEEGPYNAGQSHQQEPAKSEAEQPAIVARTVPPSKPFTEYQTAGHEKTDDGIHECFLDSFNTVKVPPVRYMEGRTNGFPDNILGSYELLSLPEDICFDRYGRYGPYGYGYSTRTGGLGLGEHGDQEGAEAVWGTVKKVDWRIVDWADAQRRCYKTNAERYKPMVSRPAPPHGFYIAEAVEAAEAVEDSRSHLPARDLVDAGSAPVETAKPDTTGTAKPEITGTAKPAGDMARTALVLRCWDEFVWREEDIMNLRALISELSLASGGRYDVHLLVQVRNDGRNPIWADDEVYRNRIKETVPEEFQGIATLWSETQMLSVYQGIVDLWTRGPDLPVHGSYRGLQMAMQHFAHNHPEYDYFWQWEMDIRYTGHYHDLLSKLELFAKEQPRKGLWERNARYYMPYVHGSWEDFRQMARVQTEHGTVNPDKLWDTAVPGSNSPHQQTPRGEQSIWGPQRPLSEKDWFEHAHDPVPPTAYERDKYTWGVGEEADLITLSPIFDPDGTTWMLADDITGYNETGGIGKPPRRAQIITASRMSRNLLLTMHRETAFKKHHAFPEMWPATVALHHGLKAVYAPHPVFVDRAWPPAYMASVLNGGRNGASGGARTSVYGDREHNLLGLTWFYNAGFSGNLYRRWMGLKVNNDGGEEFEMTEDLSADDETVGTMRGGEGRMCLPPMLLHPVKDVELPVEQYEEVVVVGGADPAA